MLSELEGRVLCGEGRDIELLDGDVGSREALAESGGEHGVAFEIGDGLLEALRQTVGADRLALFVVEVVGIDGDRRGKRQLSLDALESGRGDAASWPLKGDATRSAPSRLSGPQARKAEAHIWGCSRR